MHEHNINTSQEVTPPRDPVAEKLAQRAAHYNLQSRDIDDATHIVTVRRSSGEPDPGWVITSDGIDPRTGAAVVGLEKLAVDEQGETLHDEQGNPVIMSKVQSRDEVFRYDAEQRSPRRIETEAVPERELTRNERIFRAPEAQGRDRFGNDRDGRLRVTEESLADAEDISRFSDEDIKEFLLMAKKDNPGEDIHEVLRTNNELRVKLGEFLLQKFDGMHYLPSRLYQHNQLKSPNYAGYEGKMTSREYAALLAIGMLDGTFKKSLSDPIELEYGEAIRGQHRYAAMQVLGVQDRSQIARSQIKHLK